jgi:hypothetical protein
MVHCRLPKRGGGRFESQFNYDSLGLYDSQLSAFDDNVDLEI